MSLLREMQIKSRVKYSLSSNILTKIQKLENVLFSEALFGETMYQQYIQHAMWQLQNTAESFVTPHTWRGDVHIPTLESGWACNYLLLSANSLIPFPSAISWVMASRVLTALTKYHQPSGFKPQAFISQSSGGWEGQ